MFLSSFVQKYLYMIKSIFNIICDIVMNTLKYRFHVFKVVKLDIISTSVRSMSWPWNRGKRDLSFLCKLIILCSGKVVPPTYCTLHLLQESKYHILCVTFNIFFEWFIMLQFFCIISYLNLGSVIYLGQVRHFLSLHLKIPNPR